MAIRTTFSSRISRNSGRFSLKDFVQEMKFDRMGCFAYSKKKYAYLLEDDVPDTVKQDRANEIMEHNHRYWDLKPRKVGTNI
jgi:ribosomal protein S12 methylthiotransferase